MRYVTTEPVHVYPNIKVTPITNVVRNVFSIQIAQEKQRAFAINALTHALGHVGKWPNVLYSIMFPCAAAPQE